MTRRDERLRIIREVTDEWAARQPHTPHAEPEAEPFLSASPTAEAELQAEIERRLRAAGHPTRWDGQL